MAQQWYWMQDGQKHGPIETAGLRELARNGQLKPTDLIWREGLPHWVPATQGRGLFPDQLSGATARPAPTGQSAASASPQPPPRLQPIPQINEESGPPQDPTDLPAGYRSSLGAKGAEIKEKLTRAVGSAKKRGLALKLGHEAKSLQTAIEAQLEALGTLALGHRPATVDIGQQVTDLSTVQDELSRKQATLESLRDTKGSGSVVKELNQEVSQLHSRQRAVMVAIGRRALAARPEMPGAAGPYAALDRLESSLETKQRGLTIIEDEIGPAWRAGGLRVAAMKRPLVLAGAAAGGLLILCLLWKLLVATSPITGLLGSGYRADYPAPAIPENKTTFQKIVFTEPKYGSTIALVSETECEIQTGGNITLAKYTRQENKLRVVEGAFGAASVRYFDILPDGVRESNSGEMYLLPEPLKRYRDQVRGAQEAEQSRRRAAQEAEEQRQRAAELEHKRQEEELTKKRESVMQEVRHFLSEGSVFNGTYYSRWPNQHKDPHLPFQITITGDLTIKDYGYEETGNIFGPKYHGAPSGPLDQVFGIPAHFKWLGDTETLCPSSWGEKIKEYDGMLIGAIKIQNKGGMNPVWRVSVKYCINDPSFPGDWVSREDGSTWNGTQFEGNSKSAIGLPKP